MVCLVEVRSLYTFNFKFDGMSKDAINFISRTLVFVMLTLVVTVSYFYIFLSNVKPNKQIHAGVNRIIQKSKDADSRTKNLILGASVAFQMYPNNTNLHPNNSLTANQGVSLVGYYNLADNFLENFKGHKDSLHVYLIYFPSGFRNKLDHRYTFCLLYTSPSPRDS